MAILIPKRKPFRKPTGFVRPNVSHPHLDDCVILWALTENGGEIVRNALGPVRDGSALGATPIGWVSSTGGVAAHVGSATTQGILYNPAVDFQSSTGDKTWWIYCQPKTQNTTADRILTNEAGQSGTARRILGRWDDGELVFFDGSWRRAGSQLSLDVDHTLGWCDVGATQARKLFLDGAEDQSWTGAAQAGINNIGTHYSGSSSARVENYVYQVRIYNRLVDENELRVFHDNPWAPFEKEIVYFVPAAAAGVTIQVPLATLTLSPQVPSVAAGAAVDVPLATLTLSPQVPIVAAGAAVDVPLATLTITNLVPTVQAGGVIIEVPLATLTLTPQVPTVAAGVAVDVPLATFTLTPLVPAIAAGQVNVEVPLATLTLAPQVPTVAAGAAVDVPLATLTLTSQVPTIEAGAAINVEVPLAALTLTPQVPAVATGVTVDVPLAPLTLTPQVPTLLVGGAYQADVPLHVFTLTPLTPSIAAGASVDVPRVYNHLTALAPSLAFGVLIEVPLKTLEIFPHPPYSWGAPLASFTSLAIETSDDMTGVMTHDNVTVIFENNAYIGILAEADGETLDGGMETDGLIELQMRTADILSSQMDETAQLFIDGQHYAVGKIDTIGGEMSVLYIEPI